MLAKNLLLLKSLVASTEVKETHIIVELTLLPDKITMNFYGINAKLL